MSARPAEHTGQVLSREQISPHLARLRLGSPEGGGQGLAGLASSQVPDEWVALVVPGQFQSRYYTIRDATDGVFEVDVVIHDNGLVTEWVAGDCVGDEVTIGDPRGSFAPPAEASWLMLVGDLTAMPAISRICRTTDLPVRIWAEVPDDLAGYLPSDVDVTWIDSPGGAGHRLAEVVETLDFPEEPGYFWMAGESAQMRAIRKHLMRVRRLPTSAYDVMGYWRGGAARQPRSVDPGPVWRAGKTAGKTDEEIWADYDAAQAAAQDEAPDE